MSGSNRICKALLCLAAVCCLTACAAEPASGESEVLQPQLKTTEKAAYEIVTVERGDHIKESKGSTSVIYLMQEDLLCEKSEAHFKEMLVQKGNSVKAGDVLVRFEDEESTTQLQTLRLQAQRVNEDCNVGKQTRMQVLEEKTQKLEDLQGDALRLAELEIELLQAEYDSYAYQMNLQLSDLWEQIRELEEELNDNVIVAPFDGKITSVARLNEGDLVFRDQWLVSMVSTDQLLLSAKNDTGNLRYNMPVLIETGRGNKLEYLSGRVIAAPNVLPNDLEQSLTLIELDNPVTANELANGSLKYSAISEELLDILVVDNKIIRKENSSSYVYVLEGETVQKRYLTTGTKNTDMIWILDGLAEGQSLVVN